MDPYVDVVQTLFNYSRSQFKDLKTFFFHNSIYDFVWEDSPRRYKPQRVQDFASWDPDTRLVIVEDDHGMAPYELMATDGSIHIEERSGLPSIDRLNLLVESFPHSRVAQSYATTPLVHDKDYRNNFQHFLNV